MKDWDGIKVLVTGATGLVGSWLVKRLLSLNANVSGLVLDLDSNSELVRSGDINKIKIINGDLRSKLDITRAVAESECEIVFHLGAQTIVGEALIDPMWTFESNIAGTWHLLEALRQAGNQISAVVVASSDKAYGSSDLLPYLETYRLSGEGPYDVSKSCTDLIAQSYGKTYGLPVTIARCGNIFGGGDLNWSRIVPGTMRSLLNGTQPILRSDGSFVRDYVYVLDIVDAYIHLATKTKTENLNGEAFNFSRDQPLTVMEIYKGICEITSGVYVEPKILNAANNEIKDQYLDSSKAREILGWESKFTLESGLKETLSWYRGNVLGISI